MPGLTRIDQSLPPADLPYWLGAFNPVFKFGTGLGAPVVVTYALKTTGGNPFDQAFRDLTAGEIQNIETSLRQLSENTGLRFVTAPDATADMWVGATSAADETAYGRTWQFTGGQPVQVVAYDQPYDTPEGLARNSYIYIHELLHGVGLDHSTRAFGSISDVVIPVTEETGTTIFGRWGGAAFDGPIVPLVFDRAVLQYLYGVDVTARAGDDTYSGVLGVYDPTTDIIANDPLLWDGAGIDTIDLSTGSGGAVASLRPGFISRIDVAEDTGILAAGTFSINYGSVFERLIGTGFDDRLEGNEIANLLRGAAGNDIITPGLGSDTIEGGAGTDTANFVDATLSVIADLRAGTATSGADINTLMDVENITGSIFGDYIVTDDAVNRIRSLGDYDWLVGSAGADYFDGGNGRDMISYVFAGEGVTVDLGAGRGTGGQAAGDRYVSIERFTGSIYNDLTYGSDGADDFRGLGGYDWFVGSGGGKDRYDGGSGKDTVAYSVATSGVNASLLLGRGSGGDAARDLYDSIENLTGSSYADMLTGDNGRNVLRGLYGEDVLLGNGGVDYLTGGGSDDILNGGAGFDYAVYAGNRADYTVNQSGPGTTVRHDAGSDGTDSLFEIEAIRFADDILFL